MRKQLLSEITKRPGTFLSVSELISILEPTEQFREQPNKRLYLRKRQALHRKVLYHLQKLVKNNELVCVNDKERRMKRFGLGTESETLAHDPLKLSAHWFVKLTDLEVALTRIVPYLSKPIHILDAERLLDDKSEAIISMSRVAKQLKETIVLHIALINTKDREIADFLGAVVSSKIRAVLHVPPHQIIYHHSTLVAVSRLAVSDYVTFTFG